MAMFFIGIGVLGVVGALRANVVFQDRVIGSGISIALLLAGG
jgi:hypothetical protein